MTAKRSVRLRLADILDAAETVRTIVGDMTFEALEADVVKLWAVQRGIEIISEASRHLPDDIKARHADIPWRKVAGIGNVLRHDYETVAAPVLWNLVQVELASLECACRKELTRAAG